VILMNNTMDTMNRCWRMKWCWESFFGWFHHESQIVLNLRITLSVSNFLQNVFQVGSGGMKGVGE